MKLHHRAGQLPTNSLKAACRPASATTPRMVSWPSLTRIKRRPGLAMTRSRGLSRQWEGQWRSRVGRPPLELNFIFWFAERDAGPRAKRERPDENHNNLARPLTTISAALAPGAVFLCEARDKGAPPKGKRPRSGYQSGPAGPPLSSQPFNPADRGADWPIWGVTRTGCKPIPRME